VLVGNETDDTEENVLDVISVKPLAEPEADLVTHAEPEYD
jgi:hypothetical protein